MSTYANLERLDVCIQPVSHDSYELGMDLVLMLLIVLSGSRRGGEYKISTKRVPRTRLSLSNSTNMTACF